MPKFYIQVARTYTGYEYGQVEVEAPTAAEARNKALILVDENGLAELAGDEYTDAEPWQVTECEEITSA